MAWQVPAAQAALALGSQALGSHLDARDERERRRQARLQLGWAIDSHRRGQDAYRDERGALLDDALAGSPVMRGALPEALADNAASFAAALDANQRDAPRASGAYTRAGGGAGGRAMDAALARRRTENTASREQRRDALAAMQSLGSVLQGSAIERAPRARRIGQVDRFQRAHGEELPAQVDAIMARYGQDRPSPEQMARSALLRGLGSGLMQRGGQGLGEWWEGGGNAAS